jgi:hypothetical protein
MPWWMKRWWFWLLVWVGLVALRWARICWEEWTGRNGQDDL